MKKTNSVNVHTKTVTGMINDRRISGSTSLPATSAREAITVGKNLSARKDPVRKQRMGKGSGLKKTALIVHEEQFEIEYSRQQYSVERQLRPVPPDQGIPCQLARLPRHRSNSKPARHLMGIRCRWELDVRLNLDIDRSNSHCFRLSPLFRQHSPPGTPRNIPRMGMRGTATQALP